MQRGLLAGVRILDLSIWRPGPYATQLLAEVGADVIKIEPPGGDPMRTYPELFDSLSADKRSVVLDLKDYAGRARALELAAAADVVIEGFRPGVAARLGVGYDDVCAVNENVIYVSVSGLGQTGPLVDAPGHDLNYMAWAGVLAPDGGEPRVPAVPVADLAGGMAAAFAICAALVGRARTGEGERIDVSMADVLATWTGAVRPRAAGVELQGAGVPGYGVFATADGRHITLGVLTEDHFWRALCDVLELGDYRDLGFADRMARIEVVQAAVAAAIVAENRDDLIGRLLAAGVPAAPVLNRDEMLRGSHFAQRGLVGADPWADPAIGHPVRFAHHPAGRDNPPPNIDEHHDATFD